MTLKMDWFCGKVAVGSGKEAANRNLLKSENIGAILNIRDDIGNSMKKEANEREAEYCASEKIGYHYLPLPDFTTATDDQFARGIAFIEANVRLNRRVLVHCDAGLGRSPSFVAVYLVFNGECADADSAIARLHNERGCFDGDDSIHIPRMKEFEKRLPEKRVEIENMIESFIRNS